MEEDKLIEKVQNGELDMLGYVLLHPELKEPFMESMSSKKETHETGTIGDKPKEENSNETELKSHKSELTTEKKQGDNISDTFETALEKLEDIEQEWEDRILDYIAEHYPTQATVSAQTTSPEGLKEREAMKKDETLKKMREEADAAFNAADEKVASLFETNFHINEQESREKQIPVMTEEEYIASKGYGFSGIGDVALHKGKQRTGKQQDKVIENQAKKDEAYTRLREELRKEYQNKLSKGELRAPPTVEILQKAANGNPANESTRAATHALQKRGIDWQDDDVRFRFIGEKGAANLDKAEEAITRLNNLAVAREMEDSGKDANAIKLATGWERGADRKWRYEVEDFEIDLKGLARKNILWFNLPWGKEYDILIDKLLDGVELTEEESFRFDELSEKAGDLRKSYEENDVRYLDDYVKDAKLFEAYPEFKQMRVELYDTPTSNTGATYYESQNLIRVNESVLNRADFRSILAHEVQHAIQSIEGFARGGNSTTYRKYLDSLKEKRDAWSVLEEFGRKREELGKDASQIDVYNALIDEYLSDGLELGGRFMPSRAAFDNGFNLWVRGYDKEGYEDSYNEYQYLIGKFGLGSGNDRYNELSGEVEARNVQSRMDMTPEGRRSTLAWETEDVIRKDQIILDAAKERIELACYASTLAEKQNIPVSVINSYKDIPSDKIRRLISRKADIRGWYDIPSEQVCLYLPNAAGKADIQQTLLHEGVAHYGLRKLMGEENMHVFLDSIYRRADEKIRKDIQKIALAHNLNVRDATEEYLAKLAEKDITPDFREKVRQLLRDMLRALGFRIDIQDSELNCILSKSRGNLLLFRVKKENDSLFFKGGRREIEICNGKAFIRSNGQTIDATGILRSLDKAKIDIKNISSEQWKNMLRGQGIALNPDKPGSLFSIQKQTSGYTIRIADITKNITKSIQNEV